MSVERVLALLGGGGHAAVVADVARAGGWQVAGFFDDDADAALPELQHLGTINDFTDWARATNISIEVHAAVGDANRRAAWFDLACDWPHPALVHPTAIISPSASIGPGVLIGPMSVINARATIGRGAIINTGAIVEHDCQIGEFAHLGPRSVLGGEVTVGSHTLVGIGAVVRPRVMIGRRATIGAGAVVVSSVDDERTVLGVPARERPRTSAAAAREHQG